MVTSIWIKAEEIVEIISTSIPIGKVSHEFSPLQIDSLQRFLFEVK
jgi:hypothetical protein